MLLQLMFELMSKFESNPSGIKDSIVDFQNFFLFRELLELYFWLSNIQFVYNYSFMLKIEFLSD